MKKQFKFSKSLTNLIDDVNWLMEVANNDGLLVVTYDGGTYPYIIDIKPVQINGKFVTIEAVKPNRHDYISKERFCVTKTNLFDDGGLVALEYSLKVIKRALKSTIKQNQ